MTMIEKLARAACVSGGLDPDEIMANDGLRWSYYIPVVTAVLQSLREPSEGMMGEITPDYDGSQDHARIAIWQDMIDKALEEG